MFAACARVIIGACLMFSHAGADTAPASAERMLRVDFVAAGGDLGVQEGVYQEPENEFPFEDGAVFSAETIIGKLQSPPFAKPTRSKFQNSSLLVSVSAGDGSAPSMQRLAFCVDLDIYADRERPQDMKAKCDGEVFDYTVVKKGISLRRNGNEVAIVELPSGIYAINGNITRIPDGN